MSQQKLKPAVAGNLDFPQCCQYESLGESSDTENCSRNKKRHRIYVCVVVILAVCVLALCCVSIPLTIYTFSAMKSMEARLGSLEEKLAVVTVKYESLLLQQQQQQQQLQQQKDQESVTSHDTSTPAAILNVLRRMKRNSTRHTTINYVHLIGKGSSDATTEVGDMTIFKWQKSEPHRRIQGFSLQPSNQDISSIKIVNSGVYLIYSQAAVHGQSSANIHYYCSHNMVLKKGNGETSNILTSLLTQDNRGQAYRNISANDLRPIDTQLHMGVFFLLPDDELSVRIPPSCSHTNYSTVSQTSYFGVVKIG